MIDKNQWIKFYNLDTENLKEVFDFIDFRVDVRRLFPKCKWGNVCEQNAFNPLVEEKIWSMAKRSQGYLRTEQRKFRQLVDIWLKEIEPILEKWPQETVTDTAILEVDKAISAEQDKEFRLKPLKLKPYKRLEKQAKGKISAFINKINSIASNFQHWKVSIDAYGKLKMVNYTQELDDTLMTGLDDITGIDITRIDITGNSYITNLIIELFTDFINAIIDGTQFQECKLNECNNIALKKYCSKRCQKTDSKRQASEKIHQILRDLIYQGMKQDEEWFKQEDGITASQLKEYLEFLVQEHLKTEDGWRYIEDKNKYMSKLTEIPFLGTSNANSLSGYLRAPQVHTMLEEMGIHIKKTKQKHSNINRYRFISQNGELIRK